MASLTTWIENLIATHRLSKGSTAVLNAIAADPERASYCTAAQLAEAAGVNVATVVRAAQAVDFSGWPEFSTEVRNRFLSSLDPGKYSEAHSAVSVGPGASSLRRDLELMQVLADNLSDEAIERVAEAIMRAGSTTILATGAYVAPGTVVAHNLQSLGYPVTLATGSVTTMINATRALGPGDCLLTFSIWKTSAAIPPLCSVAKERGVRVVVIADQRTYLTDLADDLLMVPTQGLSTLASLTCAVSIAQCLVSTIAEADPGRTSAMLNELQELWSLTNAVSPD